MDVYISSWNHQCQLRTFLIEKCVWKRCFAGGFFFQVECIRAMFLNFRIHEIQLRVMDMKQASISVAKGRKLWVTGCSLCLLGKGRCGSTKSDLVSVERCFFLETTKAVITSKAPLALFSMSLCEEAQHSCHLWQK